MKDSETRPLEGVEGYESPRIETIMTPEQLEREILYAGEPMSVMNM